MSGLSRDEAIERIKAALKAKSNLPWSVMHGKGTSSGIIEVHAPPSRRSSPYGYMREFDRDRLALLFRLPLGSVHFQGLMIEACDRLKYVIAIESTPAWFPGASLPTDLFSCKCGQAVLTYLHRARGANGES